MRSWSEVLAGAADGAETIAVARFGVDGEVLDANAGMRMMLGLDEGERDPTRRFQSPRFDVLCGVGQGVVYEGLVTFGDGLDAGVTLAARVVRTGDVVVVVAEHDIREHLRLERTLLGLNQEVNNLQRSLLREKRELQRTLDELEQANARLRELDAQKDRFLGIAAHDLRNPLSSVRGYATLLKLPGVLDGDARGEALDAIERGADKMLGLVEDLLDLSKISRGHVDIEKDGVDVYDFVRAVSVLQRPVARTKGIELGVEIEREAGSWRFDPARMEQVLDNLLSNAFKFSDPGTRVLLTVKQVDGQLELTVSDEGRGIPADELGQVFGEFTQTSTAATAGESGTGLGLAICRRIVELHGGTIDVQSELGVGSTFRVRLP